MLGRARPPVQLELAACLDDARDAIELAVRVELGEPGAEQATPVVVAVACAAGGVDAGVVLEVRPPGSPRSYRYALDWRAQPRDARPRLIGLAVAEAVDASRIELTAVAEPVAPERRIAPAPPAGSDWSVAVRGGRREFSGNNGNNGVTTLGVGLMPILRLSRDLAVAADLVAETATVVTADGVIDVQSVSTAPRVAFRVGARLYGELGTGARIGVVRIRGVALPGSPLVGGSVVRAWLGPEADVAAGFDLTPRVSLRADLELGFVATGATVHELGQPAAAFSGAWNSFGLAVALAL